MKKIFVVSILVVMAFLLARYSVFFARVRDVPYTRITEGGTFGRHLEYIMQLGPYWEPPPTEHEFQLQRLREFAKKLNAGGTDLSDLRITRVWGHPGRTLGTWCERTQQARQVSFDLTFNHEEDFDNAELIEEMLTFAGICEDDISINLSFTGYLMLWGNVSQFEFMLSNAAVYEFVKPYLRLREYAMYVNSGTTFLDEVVITYIDEDFLQVNEELGALYNQFKRLLLFSDLVMVRSARRNIVMDLVIWGMSPAASRGEGSGFSVSLDECSLHHEDFKKTLHAFTGIAKDNIDFEPAMIFGWYHPTRHNLTPRQQAQYDALLAFKEYVNAPFWYDSYLHDPVIVQINLGGRWNHNMRRFILTHFDVMLYDPELLGLTDSEIIRRTSSLGHQITAATGVRNIRPKAFVPPVWPPNQE